MGLTKRPVLDDSKVHGVRLKRHLGYYPVQIEAYKKLLKVLCEYYDIPFCAPLDDNIELLKGVHQDSVKARFKGVVCHYHLTRGKIDCAGLELKKIIDQLC